MKVSISKLRIFVLSSFLCLASGLHAQLVTIQSSSFPSLPATSCTITPLDVGVQLGCGNMTHTGNTVNISGSTITVDINYTIGPICLPVIVTTSHSISLGMVPAGNYTVVINGVENSTVVSTLNTTLSVASCCGADADFVPTKNKVCAGDSVFFNNMSTGGTGNTWYENNVLVSTDTSFGKVYTTPGSYDIKLVVADTGCADSITKTILVSNTPPSLNLGPDTSICPGDLLVLDSGGSRDSVEWNDGSTLRSLLVSSPGTYYVTVFKDGCSNSDTVVVGDESIPVHLGNDTTICLGDTLMLDATYAGASYQWQDNSTNPIFNVTTSGTYYVKRTVNGCAAYDTVEVVVDSCGTGLYEGYVIAKDVDIYPNPVVDVLGIEITF